MCPVENPVQVPHAGSAVNRLPELGQLDGPLDPNLIRRVREEGYPNEGM